MDANRQCPVNKIMRYQDQYISDAFSLQFSCEELNLIIEMNYRKIVSINARY